MPKCVYWTASRLQHIYMDNYVLPLCYDFPVHIYMNPTPPPKKLRIISVYLMPVRWVFYTRWHFDRTRSCRGKACYSVLGVWFKRTLKLLRFLANYKFPYSKNMKHRRLGSWFIRDQIICCLNSLHLIKPPTQLFVILITSLTLHVNSGS